MPPIEQSVMNATDARHLWVWYTPYGQGGVETYLLNMARETTLAGGQVWVAATKSAEGPLRERFLDAGAQLLDWTGFQDAFMSKSPAEPVRSRLVADLARIAPTLLALNDCNDFSMGVAPLLRRLRPYCTVLDTLHIDSPLDQYLDFRSIFADVLDGIAATNENVIERFRGRHRNARELEIRYIPNGVTVSERGRAPPGDTLRLLYVGRLAQDQKRILDLPPLLKELQARGKAFTMTIVGDGPAREALAADLAVRGLAGRVRLTGYLPPQQVADLYLDHDVLVNLSAFEGFSMSVLEALAAGCVPVCTDVASLDHSVFIDHRNCRLCPVERLQDMPAIWAGLIPESLQRMSAAARATGRRFTARNTFLAYQALVKSLRARRPLRAWPSDAAAALSIQWDLTRDNPWLGKPHPLRQFARSLWARVSHT
jgi:glycosyltransferase involved in cell wall biosynthesis